MVRPFRRTFWKFLTSKVNTALLYGSAIPPPGMKRDNEKRRSHEDLYTNLPRSCSRSAQGSPAGEGTRKTAGLQENKQAPPRMDLRS